MWSRLLLLAGIAGSAALPTMTHASLQVCADRAKPLEDRTRRMRRLLSAVPC